MYIGKTYKNLNRLQKSFEIHNQILDILNTDNIEYRQVIANNLIGLAELYRMQRDFDVALSNHFKSIELLNKIGAKCDLAEAYFQLGLTYQAMGEQDQAEEYKAKALELFEQMEAPRQIERVNKAFGGNIQ
jgi:tetratricopeptide (TPR) repeat protein